MSIRAFRNTLRYISLVAVSLGLGFTGACDRKSPVPATQPADTVKSPSVAEDKSPSPSIQSPASKTETMSPSPASPAKEAPRASDVKPVLPGTKPTKVNQPAMTPSGNATTIIPEPNLTNVTEDYRAEVQLAVQRARTNPQDPVALGELGMYYLAADWPLDAIACFKLAAELDSSSFAWAYCLGLAHEKAYNQSEALHAFERAAELNAEYGAALIHLGNILLKTASGDPARARACFERALKLLPDSPQVFYGLGESARLAGDQEAAMRHYQTALQYAPRYAAVHNAMVEVFTKAGQKQQAATHRRERDAGVTPPLCDPLQDRITRKSMATNVILNDAERLVDEGNLDEAIKNLEGVVGERPGLLTARNALGTLCLMQGRFADAAGQFEAYLALRPDNLDAALNLGGALLAEGRFAEAEPHYRRILATQVDSLPAKEGLGEVLLRTNRADEALELFRKAVIAQSKQATPYLDLAAALVSQKKYAQAVDTYRQGRELLSEQEKPIVQFIGRLMVFMINRGPEKGAIVSRGLIGMPEMQALAEQFAAQKMEREAEITRNYVEVISANAMIMTQRRQFGGAVRLLEGLFDVDSNGVLRHAIGNVYLAERKFEDAARCYRQVLETYPDSYQSKSGLGAVQAELGDQPQAERLFQEVLTQQPNDTTTLMRMATLRVLQGKNDEAVTFAKRAFEAKPDDAGVCYNYAELLARTGQEKAAVQELKNLVQREPEMVRALYSLGMLSTKAGDLNAAKDYLRRVIRIAPQSVDGYVGLAQATLQEKDWEEGIKILRTGVKVAPNAPILANALAWCLATVPTPELRNGAEAVELAEAACRAAKDNQAEYFDTLGAAYAEVGRFPDAVKASKQAIEYAGKSQQKMDLAAFKQRLALYQAGKPYREKN